MIDERTITTDAPSALSLGQHFKLKRMDLALSTKDVAIKLRLSEHLIESLENDASLQHLPAAFVHGYMRSYGKLLELSPTILERHIAALQLTTPLEMTQNQNKEYKNKSILINSRYFVRLGTLLVSLIMVSLFGMWWHTHREKEVTFLTPQVQSEPLSSIEQVNSEPSGLDHQPENKPPYLTEDGIAHD